MLIALDSTTNNTPIDENRNDPAALRGSLRIELLKTTTFSTAPFLGYFLLGVMSMSSFFTSETNNDRTSHQSQQTILRGQYSARDTFGH